MKTFTSRVDADNILMNFPQQQKTILQRCIGQIKKVKKQPQAHLIKKIILKEVPQVVVLRICSAAMQR